MGTVTVQVQPMNDAADRRQRYLHRRRGQHRQLPECAANDGFAPDQDETLRVTAVGTTSQGGTVTIAPNGTHLLYTPKAGFGGQETFTYTISDRTGTGGLTATATVTMTVESGPLPTANRRHGHDGRRRQLKPRSMSWPTIRPARPAAPSR